MTDLTAAWQLPDGVDALLPDDAWRVDQLRRQFTDCCRRSGYELVMPPLIEYIDSLLTGTGETTSLQTFKVVDQQSGRTLGIRADMTPQVARLDAHLLKSDTPQRLCYTGSVLRARTDGFGGSRSPQQFGAELFGHASVAADVEIIRLMMDTTQAAGLASDAIVLDLGHVGVYQGLCAAADFSKSNEEAVFAAMHLGSLPDMEMALAKANCAPSLTSAFLALLSLRGGPETLESAESTLLSNAVLSEISQASAANIRSSLNTLNAVVTAVQRSHPTTPLVLDLSEARGYRYHTGMLFAVYSVIGDVIARGGRYDAMSAAFGRQRPATGFSGDLTQLARLASKSGASTRESKSPPGVWVPKLDSLTADQETELWAAIRALRQSGERVVLALPNDTLTAEQQACDRQLIQHDADWTVVPISLNAS